MFWNQNKYCPDVQYFTQPCMFFEFRDFQIYQLYTCYRETGAADMEWYADGDPGHLANLLQG